VIENEMTKKVKGRTEEQLWFWKLAQGQNRHNLSFIQRIQHFSPRRCQRCFCNFISWFLGMLLKQERIL